MGFGSLTVDAQIHVVKEIALGDQGVGGLTDQTFANGSVAKRYQRIDIMRNFGFLPLPVTGSCYSNRRDLS